MGANGSGKSTLVKLMLGTANFLVLDEPTNHPDIPSAEVLEEALAEFERTVLIVSHDRYLLDKVTDRTLELKDGRLSDFPAPYSEVLSRREREP